MNAFPDAGYSSFRGLCERAPSQLGITPATYQRGGKGAQVNFTIMPCSLGKISVGKILVAGTPNGVCSVSLGDTTKALEAELRREFPSAQAQPRGTRLTEWAETVLKILEGQETLSDLPLDVQATAFQWKVWQALCSIPRGSTLSYSQVANLIGQPTAARAVARACATNPIALIVPCHRVVRGDGSMGGYRWGMDKKKSLLACEKEGTTI